LLKSTSGIGMLSRSVFLTCAMESLLVRHLALKYVSITDELRRPRMYLNYTLVLELYKKYRDCSG
jgi:hypothetical protein